MVPYGHLLAVNGSLYFGPKPEGKTTPKVAGGEVGVAAATEVGVATEVYGGVGVRHVELLQDKGGRGGGRRLMGVSEDERLLADMVARSKHKELSQEGDLRRCVSVYVVRRPAIDLCSPPPPPPHRSQEDWEKKYGPWVGHMIIIAAHMIQLGWSHELAPEDRVQI